LVLSSIKSITPELKSKILSEIIVPGVVISQIAKSYNLSPKNLYNWRNHYFRKLGEPRKAQKLSSSVKSSNQFIELKPYPDLILPEASSSNLSQISLTLNNISVSLKGNIKTASLIKILAVLEEQSC